MTNRGDSSSSSSIRIIIVIIIIISSSSSSSSRRIRIIIVIIIIIISSSSNNNSNSTIIVISTAGTEVVVVWGDCISSGTLKGEGLEAGGSVCMEVVVLRRSGVGEEVIHRNTLPPAATTTPDTHRASLIPSVRRMDLFPGIAPPADPHTFRFHCLVDSSSPGRVRTVEAILPPPVGTGMPSVSLVLLLQPLVGTVPSETEDMRTARTDTTDMRTARTDTPDMRTTRTATTSTRTTITGTTTKINRGRHRDNRCPQSHLFSRLPCRRFFGCPPRRRRISHRLHRRRRKFILHRHSVSRRRRPHSNNTLPSCLGLFLPGQL